MLLAPSFAFGQQPEPIEADATSSSSREDDVAPRIRIVERSPRLIYVQDADGNRVPLINVPLERIQQLLDEIFGRYRPPTTAQVSNRPG